MQTFRLKGQCEFWNIRHDIVQVKVETSGQLKLFRSVHRLYSEGRMVLCAVYRDITAQCKAHFMQIP